MHITFDLYIDYLLSSFGLTSAAGLSSVPEGQISRDRITRMLSEKTGTSADLRLTVKHLIRQVESPAGILTAAETEYYTDTEDGKTERRCPVPENQ